MKLYKKIFSITFVGLLVMQPMIAQEQPSRFSQICDHAVSIGQNVGNIAWSGIKQLPTVCAATLCVLAKTTGVLKKITEYPVLAAATGATIAGGYYLKKYNEPVWKLIREAEEVLQRQAKPGAPLYWFMHEAQDTVQNPYNLFNQYNNLEDLKDEFLEKLNELDEPSWNLCSCDRINISLKFARIFKPSLDELDRIMESLKPHCSLPEYAKELCKAFDWRQFECIKDNYNDLLKMVVPSSKVDQLKMYYLPSYAARSIYLRALGLKMLLNCFQHTIHTRGAEIVWKDLLSNYYNVGHCQSIYCCNK